MFARGSRNPNWKGREGSSDERYNWSGAEEAEIVVGADFLSLDLASLSTTDAERLAVFISQRTLLPTRSAKSVQSKAARVAEAPDAERGSEAAAAATESGADVTPVLEWFSNAGDAERLRFLRVLLPLLNDSEREYLREKFEKRSVRGIAAATDSRCRQLKQKCQTIWDCAVRFFAAGETTDNASLSAGFAALFEGRYDLFRSICRLVGNGRYLAEYRASIASRVTPALLSLGAVVKSYMGVSDRMWLSFFRPLYSALVPVLGFEVIPSLNAVRTIGRNFASALRSSLVETSSPRGSRGLWLLADAVLRSLLSFPSVRASIRGSLIVAEWGADGREMFKECFQVAFFLKLVGIPCLANSAFNVHTTGLISSAEEYGEIALHGGDFFASVRLLNTLEFGDGNSIGVKSVWCFDGSLARIITGRSSAASRHPVRMLSVDQDAARDLTVIMEPDITANGTDADAALFEAATCNGRLKETDRSSWAAAHHGNLHRNLIGFDAVDVFPGTLHWRLRAFGTLTGKAISLACSVGMRETVLQEFRREHLYCKIVFHGEVPVVDFTGRQLDQLRTIHSRLFACLPEQNRQAILHLIFRALFSAFDSLLSRSASHSTVESTAVALRTAVGFLSFAFGRSAITPTLTEVALTAGFYLERALSIGDMSGLPLTLWHFSEEPFEAKHEPAQLGASLHTNHKPDNVLNKTFTDEYLVFGISETFLQEGDRFGPMSTFARASAAEADQLPQPLLGLLPPIPATPCDLEDESTLIVEELSVANDDDTSQPATFGVVEELSDSDSDSDGESTDTDESNNSHR